MYYIAEKFGDQDWKGRHYGHIAYFFVIKLQKIVNTRFKMYKINTCSLNGLTALICSGVENVCFVQIKQKQNDLCLLGNILQQRATFGEVLVFCVKLIYVIIYDIYNSHVNKISYKKCQTKSRYAIIGIKQTHEDQVCCTLYNFQ